MVPYIGVTGFRDEVQVKEMREIFNAYSSPGSDRVLHAGVMTSYRAIRGLPHSWQHAFPATEEIASILSFEDVYNCVHYADFRTRNEVWGYLVMAIHYGGKHIHALQLDMTWPDPDQIAKALDHYKKPLEVILQIGRDAFDAIHDDPRCLVEKLEKYQGAIRRVLLDKSMGGGLPLDADGLLPFTLAIKEYYPQLGIAVAGGLGPHTLDLVLPLLKRFPDLSIDAQGQLHQGGDSKYPIDIRLVREYLAKSLKLVACRSQTPP